MEPTILHYASNKFHPQLHRSVARVVRGGFQHSFLEYEFEGMRAKAIGANFPEWEPNRIAANILWKKALGNFDKIVLVTGSAHVGLPLVTLKREFTAWVSSTVSDDREARLAVQNNFAGRLERFGLPIIYRAEKEVLQNAKRVLAVSDNAKNNLEKLSSRSVELWPFPIDTNIFFRPSEKGLHSKLKLLFVGRTIDPRKDFPLFLRVLESLKKSNVTFEATVIGDNTSSLSHSLSITFLPNLTAAELREQYQQHDLLLLTSQQEGLGIAAMEAMACGTPVISTKCGGPDTYIQNGINGVLIEGGEAEFVAAISALVGDQGRYNRMSVQAANTIADEFSQQRWNSKFEDLLLNC